MTPALFVLAGAAVAARIDVEVEHDKTFDFKQVRTWDWPAAGAGQVLMARTEADNAAAMKQRAEPIIVDAVAEQMAARGMTRASGHPPDLTVTYYLLLATTMTAQTMGQFLPDYWGMPLFPPATQSLNIMNVGTLVLDLRGADRIVWRGKADAKIRFEATDQERERLLREAVRDLLRRFPPRS
jgi:hypothetical protein